MAVNVQNCQTIAEILLLLIKYLKSTQAQADFSSLLINNIKKNEGISKFFDISDRISEKDFLIKIEKKYSALALFTRMTLVPTTVNSAM